GEPRVPPQPQQQPEMPPPQQQQASPGEHHVRTDIPAAHVSHSSRTFVVEGVRWRQQTITWTWPEGPAEDGAAAEEPRIWEEEAPRVSPRDPRVRGRPEASPTAAPTAAEPWTSDAPPPAATEPWKPPTPSTGPGTPASPGVAADDARRQDEPLERGSWVWPEPLACRRPQLKRQHSAPEVGEEVARPELVRQMSAPEGQRWHEIGRDEWPEGIAEVQAVKEARILGGRRSVRVRMDRRAFRVRLGPADMRLFEEQQ
ncbi:hypothetical protein KR084_011139, partial [Drosophila pseudotakahashii]